MTAEQIGALLTNHADSLSPTDAGGACVGLGLIAAAKIIASVIEKPTPARCAECDHDTPHTDQQNTDGSYSGCPRRLCGCNEKWPIPLGLPRRGCVTHLAGVQHVQVPSTSRCYCGALQAIYT